MHAFRSYIFAVRIACNSGPTCLHSLDFVILKCHRSLDYVNLIIFIQVLSYCYWTEYPLLTLLIRWSPIPKCASGARFFDCLLIGLIGYI